MTKVKKLPSERDSERVAKMVRGAFLRTHRRRAKTFFEHGHWWVEDKDGRIYSVFDAVGGGSVYGFGFEHVSGGED